MGQGQIVENMHHVTTACNLFVHLIELFSISHCKLMNVRQERKRCRYNSAHCQSFISRSLCVEFFVAQVAFPEHDLIKH